MQFSCSYSLVSLQCVRLDLPLQRGPVYVMGSGAIPIQWHHTLVWQNAERQMLLQHYQGSEEEVNGFIGTSMEEERGITFLSMIQGKKITYHNEYLMQKQDFQYNYDV